MDNLLPGETVLTQSASPDAGALRVVASVAILDTLSLSGQSMSGDRWVTDDRVVLRRDEMEALARLLISLGYGKGA